MSSWVDFYFEHGRFPGSQKLVLLPHVEKPHYIDAETPFSPIDLYKKIGQSDTKALCSVQALVALNIHFG